MPGPHQIATDILSGPYQVTGRLLLRRRHRDRDDLVQAQKLGQVPGIAGVLTRSPGGRWIFDGAAISHLIPAVVKARARPNPVGPAS